MNIDAVYVTIQTIVQSNMAKGCIPLKSKVLHPVQDLNPIIGVIILVIQWLVNY